MLVLGIVTCQEWSGTTMQTDKRVYEMLHKIPIMSSKFYKLIEKRDYKSYEAKKHSTSGIIHDQLYKKI